MERVSCPLCEGRKLTGLKEFDRVPLVQCVDCFGVSMPDLASEEILVAYCGFICTRKRVGAKKTVEEGGLYSESARTTDEGVCSLLEANTSLGVGKLTVDELLDVSGFGDAERRLP